MCSNRAPCSIYPGAKQALINVSYASAACPAAKAAYAASCGSCVTGVKPSWWAGAMRSRSKGSLQCRGKLYNEFRVEVSVLAWNHQKFIRVSFQGYNTQADADTLVEALERLLR
jgi:selenocysteine lyase/cysteine desulfurase